MRPYYGHLRAASVTKELSGHWKYDAKGSKWCKIISHTYLTLLIPQLLIPHSNASLVPLEMEAAGDL